MDDQTILHEMYKFFFGEIIGPLEEPVEFSSWKKGGAPDWDFDTDHNGPHGCDVPTVRA